MPPPAIDDIMHNYALLWFQSRMWQRDLTALSTGSFENWSSSRPIYAPTKNLCCSILRSSHYKSNQNWFWRFLELLSLSFSQQKSGIFPHLIDFLISFKMRYHSVWILDTISFQINTHTSSSTLYIYFFALFVLFKTDRPLDLYWWYLVIFIYIYINGYFFSFISRKWVSRVNSTVFCSA